MNLTNHELALLADSVFWEMEFWEARHDQLAAWQDTPRAKTLQALQDRIHSHLESSGYYRDRADLA